MGRLEPFQFSLRARQDLAELYDHVASESGADRADALRHEFDSALRLLAGVPGMGPWREELADEGPSRLEGVPLVDRLSARDESARDRPRSGWLAGAVGADAGERGRVMRG
ncbi:MAG: type II toxin-antitoxin system RelE/ParE family toxin [Planctomycetes bacterium]|nr:type II toxin-antitoxin system RelE/ParE family toxin [Planctomycetota bacterium]